MSKARVLVGTRKGAFVLTSDGKRKQLGCERAALRRLGDLPRGWLSRWIPNRLYASQSSGWFGQLIQRSDDGGATWAPVGNKFVYDGVAGTHQWYDGTAHPWEFKRVWHLEPSLTDPDTVYAGVEDAALFRSSDGGQNWEELSGLRKHGSGAAMAAGRRRHVPAHDHSRPVRSRIESTLRSPLPARFAPTTAERVGAPINRGLYLPIHSRSDGGSRALRSQDRDASIASRRALHAEALGRDAQRRCGRRVARGERQSADRLRVRRSTCTRTSRKPIYVVPIKSDSEHYPLDGKLQVFRSRSGGGEWEALTKGLPQENCYVNVLRDAMAVDSFDECGVYFGTTGGQVYASTNAGDSWEPIVRDLPAVLSVEVQTLS